jgi:hypothetical protein
LEGVERYVIWMCVRLGLTLESVRGRKDASLRIYAAHLSR